MQITIDQYTPQSIWGAAIRDFLEKIAEGNFGDSIELRFVELNVLRLIRKSSENHYTFENTHPPEHRLITVQLENRLSVTSNVKDVEQGLKIFVEQDECKMLIIKFDGSNTRLHLIKEESGLVVWAETHDEEFHGRETVPFIKLTTPNASA